MIDLVEYFSHIQATSISNCVQVMFLQVSAHSIDFRRFPPSEITALSYRTVLMAIRFVFPMNDINKIIFVDIALALKFQIKTVNTSAHDSTHKITSLLLLYVNTLFFTWPTRTPYVNFMVLSRQI